MTYKLTIFDDLKIGQKAAVQTMFPHVCPHKQVVMGSSDGANLLLQGGDHEM